MNEDFPLVLELVKYLLHHKKETIMVATLHPKITFKRHLNYLKDIKNLIKEVNPIKLIIVDYNDNMIFFKNPTDDSNRGLRKPNIYYSEF